MKLKLSSDLWLLDVVFHYLKERLDRRVLVGGDFNYSRLLDDLYGLSGNHEFFDRIADEGFVSLHRLFHVGDEQTFFRKNGQPHQLDYWYADAGLSGHAVACEVVPYEEVSKFSDHTPLIAHLDL